jgi:hypothetical protein
MTEQTPESYVNQNESQPLEQIAFRDGDPSDWSGYEAGYEVADRICAALGLTFYTPEIRAVGIAESERQKALYESHQQLAREQAENDNYRSRMGEVATGLVDALVPEDDPRDKEEVTEAVLKALRPLDRRLTLSEWDGVVGRHQ